MVYQNTYRGVPIPDSTAGGNIFPIPAPEYNIHPPHRLYVDCDDRALSTLAVRMSIPKQATLPGTTSTIDYIIAIHLTSALKSEAGQVN